jgi:hypothetical protein
MSAYLKKPKKKKTVAFSPQANNTDRVNAAVSEVSANFLRIEGVAWSAQRIPPAANSVFLTGATTFSFK